MFQKTCLQLTLSYLGVLTIILSVFTSVVRSTFARSLSQQLTLRLENLAKAASFNMDIEVGEFDIDEEEIIVSQTQVVQWFDLQGNLISQQGEYHIYPHSMISITYPVKDLNTGEEIGYVRVSESKDELKNTLRRLDYGLGIGVAIAFLLSGFGSIWLTRRAMQPIENSFDRLKQFTADASHELRNPLMAIRANADVALKYPSSIRQSDVEKFAAISSAAHQMTRLMENLLLLARTDQIQNLQKKLVNITWMLSNLVQLYKVQTKDKKFTWQQELEKNLYILGDEVLLKQLFVNLLQNALCYTPKGGSIIIEAKQTSCLVIQIKDTGIGIAPEHLERIFDRFWRVDKSRSYQTGQSGLGLAIVKEIVQLHQGKISVKSQLGVGSCFTVSLPSI
ncbi:cell wall metabolism sensor histidine kinase WalK [Gloeocapsa sp. PCC 73106]|uniref:sensor histidine kinase n=1 Tax=Gloeocapsa sp. PCC 73106 TaxID=102232 RepID=UPI0002ABC849|nr:HAMP domain-containing sensor histidine kinase [Gloeocapsa sp. PCC 73106]ELR96508.1 histidine kinase [Gloeocapsa sp. PCC 73106]